MATLIDDDRWLCVDCTMFHANGDLPECGERAAEVVGAFEATAPNHWVLNDGPEDGGGEIEFSWLPCDCCRSRLGGTRVRFALFGPAGSE
jgi:hypothetical protein